jgi:hypothetical protein
MCILTLQDSVHKLSSKQQIYLARKIIYSDSAEMEKHFYKKIYFITLCNFWHRSLPWPNTQHIQKLATEDLYILRYCRSKFFTFVFFMQKLSGISSGQNNKSCIIIHHEPKKIGFAFFRCFYDFIRNLQETGKSLLLFELPFCREALGKKLRFAMWSWAAGQRRSGQIPANRRPGPAGHGRGRVPGS